MKTLYAAYGMNTNNDEMAERCPTARFLGTAVLEGWRLEFNGVADVREVADAACHVTLWELEVDDELALDTLEGFPYLYRKEYLLMRHPKTGDLEAVMIYKMNEGHKRAQLSPPAEFYWQMLVDGYRPHGLPMTQLVEALQRARDGASRRSQQHLDYLLEQEA
jgi:hypothetical protein